MGITKSACSSSCRQTLAAASRLLKLALELGAAWMNPPFSLGPTGCSAGRGGKRCSLPAVRGENCPEKLLLPWVLVPPDRGVRCRALLALWVQASLGFYPPPCPSPLQQLEIRRAEGCWQAVRGQIKLPVTAPLLGVR